MGHLPNYVCVVGWLWCKGRAEDCGFDYHFTHQSIEVSLGKALNIVPSVCGCLCAWGNRTMTVKFFGPSNKVEKCYKTILKRCQNPGFEGLPLKLLIGQAHLIHIICTDETEFLENHQKAGHQHLEFHIAIHSLPFSASAIWSLIFTLLLFSFLQDLRKSFDKAWKDYEAKL